MTEPAWRPLAALLLVACHPFQSAAIDQTCEDLGTCAGMAEADADTDADSDADTDADAELEPALGWALSRRTAAGSLVSVHAPLDLHSLLEVDSPDEFGGPLAWDADSGRLFVRSGAQLLVYKEDPAQSVVYELGEVSADDLAVVDGVVYQATAKGLYGLDKDGWFAAAGEAPWNHPRRLEPDGAGGLLVVDEVSDTTDPYVTIVTYAPSSDTAAGTFPRYDSSLARSEAGMALEPDGTLLVCSAGGEAWAVEDLTAGKVEARWALGAASPADVVACAWDEGLGSLVFASASEGLLTLSAEGDVVDVFPLEEGDTLLAARPW